MKPMSLRRRRFYFYALSAIFLIIIPFITLYTSGYRISSDFRIVETGGVYIYSPEIGSEIYINDKKEKTTGVFQRDLFVQNMKPGTYIILVSKDNFWPWAKEVTIEERKVSEAIAFLIPKEPEKELLEEYKVSTKSTKSSATTTAENPDYTKAIELFEIEEERLGELEIATATDSDSSFTYISHRGNVGLKKGAYGRIFATWLKDMDRIPNYFCRNGGCKKTVMVFNSSVPIKSFGFYPQREDVVLIAVNNGIYAIEIDSRKNQNFQPVYTGINPAFVLDNSNIYIKDTGKLYKISL